MMFVIFLDAALLVVFGIFLSYLALISAAAALAPGRKLATESARQLFAIVIPAHDEERTIEKTLRSLFAVDYPGELFDVVVVADNCTDRTAGIARSLGATVLERSDPRRGKGHALRWAFDLLHESGRGYDAYVVIDADSEVSQNLLSVLNVYLLGGGMAIQVADIVRPRPGVWSPEVIRLAFTLYNVVRPLGRRALGFSTSLHGNGMCFAARTLREVPWEAYALTEDLEYGLSLLLRGIRIIFAPEASVTATMPDKASNTESQRARWEAGRLPVVRRYAEKIIAACARRPSIRFVEALIDLTMPPFVNMLAGVSLMLGVHFLLWAAAGVDAALTFGAWWAALLALGIIHVFAGMRAARADGALYRALLYVPRYALWKVRLYGKLLRTGSPVRWVRTTREHQL